MTARVHILGAGTPTPTPARFGSATAVQLADTCLLFDCGPATTHKLVKAGLRPTQVDYLFFTHHHFDHDVDYPCFLLCRWDQSTGVERPLHVFGPPPTERLTERLLHPEQGAFAHDWQARVNAPTSQRVHVNRGGRLPRPAPFVHARDVGPGLVYEGPGWRVTAAPAEHVQPHLASLAYRLDTADGSLAITGDTQPCATVAELARGVDLLLCMCWDDQDTMEANGEALGQCGTRGAARMAREAGAKRLLLTHMGPRVAAHGALERALGDVAREFSGEVLFAEELMTVTL